MKKFLITALLSFGLILFTQAQSNFKGTWRGELRNAEGFEWQTIMHIGESDARISFPDWGMIRLKTDSLTMTNKSIEFKVLWLDAWVKGTLDGNVIKFDWSNWGTAEGIVHKSDNSPNLFKREALSYTADDGITLKGTLILPNTSPPYNAMVLTHGSGRDTRLTGPYIGKAHLAVENGLAVLIYDKRGAGESEGGGFSTLNRLTKDALGMVSILRKHQLINSEGIGIGGISQGGWIAPKAAYSDDNIAFVFTTATPGITPAEQNVFTLETRMEDLKKRKYAKRALRTLYEFYHTNDPELKERVIEMMNNQQFKLNEDNMFRRLMFLGTDTIPSEVDAGFWAEAMFQDPLVWWSEIKVPVASFSGRDDQNVPTIFSTNLIEAALQDAGNNDYELNLYPDAGHGLSLENLPEKDWPRMAIGYVEMMGAWFAKMAKTEANNK